MGQSGASFGAIRGKGRREVAGFGVVSGALHKTIKTLM